MKKLIIPILLCLVGVARADNSIVQMLQYYNSAASGTTCATGYFGNDTQEASSFNSAAGQIYCLRVALGCNTTIDEMGAYAQFTDSTSSEVRFLLYTDNSGEPDALIANYGACADGEPTTCYETTTNPGPAWVVDSTVGAVITGTPAYIWACVQLEGTNKRLMLNTTGGDGRTYTGTFDSPPDPWPVDSDSTTVYNYAIRVHAQ